MATEVISRMLGRLHKTVGRSTLGIYVALKVRNQCNAVIRARLSDGSNAELNGELLLLRLIAPKAHFFVDVGANVGTWSKRFLDSMPSDGSGLLFEPSTESANRARALLSQYELRVEFVEAAVGEASGDAEFYAEPQFGETSSIVKGFSRSDAVTRTVRVTTLDSEFEARGIEYVDFLKVDAEGSDLKVLKGARHALEDQRIGIFQFEYNAPWALAGSTLADAMSWLGRCGYAVFLLKAHGLYSLDYCSYGEFFGYSNFVAVSPQCMAIIAPIVRNAL